MANFYDDPRLASPGSPGAGGGWSPNKLTNFDKLGVGIACFGALIIILLRALVVPNAVAIYTPLDHIMPGITKIVYSRGYAAASAMLMLFFAWYGTRQRRLFDTNTASWIFFCGIVTSVAANALLVYGLYTPVSGAMDLLGPG